MQKTNFTPSQLRAFKTDLRNFETPFKVIAQGIEKPLRFATEDEAIEFYNNHQGRCLVSYNTKYGVQYIAYKFK